ncbi:hypothetical protein [Escherichia coli]|nr:hypothetical protein [Escherichia coli]
MIDVIGSKDEAEQIIKEVVNFAEAELHLDISKKTASLIRRKDLLFSIMK